jgi:RNA polymerase sigma-70 factor (family 1)
MDDRQVSTQVNLPPTCGEDERSLVRELKAGDDAALGALIERHWVDLIQYAVRFVETQDQAEDIVQEAFVRLWSERTTWRRNQTLRPVLFRIARNLALNEKRRRGNFRRWMRSFRWSERDPRPSPHRQMRQAELVEIVREAVDALPERRREIFLLVRSHQMTYREAGEVLGIAPQTVANQMTKAVEDLREALGPHLEAYGPEEISFPRRGAG